MAFNITTAKQTNLWGKQSTPGADIGLEPQRNDLYMVDFTNAVKNVEAVSKKTLAPFLPQYVRSCTLPELRTKSEPIRRDSIPYNMPSWDDPLDAIKIVFLLETSTQTYSTVVAFMDLWLALTRAGRGSRQAGYYTTLGWFRLNSSYSVDFRFDVFLYLLRGASASNNFVQNDAFNRNQATTQITPAQAAIERVGNQLNATIGATVNPGNSGVITNLVQHSTYTFKNAWLGAYKMSDFNYTENGLVTVDATFYADSCQTTNVAFQGEPNQVDANGRNGNVGLVLSSGA